MRKHPFSGLRLVATTTAIAALLAISAGPVAADTTPPGDASYSQNGSTAELGAGACIDNGDQTFTCTEQQLGVFAGKMTDSVSGVTHTSQVCVAFGTYTYSELTGDYVGDPIFERGCRADLPTGTIKFDSKLNWATLAATHVTVEQLVCDKSDDTYECVPTSSRDVIVAATWTGVGPLSTSKHRGSGDDGTCRYSESFKGTDRSSVVSATFDGVTLGGDIYAFLSTGRYGFKSSCSEV